MRARTYTRTHIELTLQIKHWIISEIVIIQIPARMFGTGFEYKHGDPYDSNSREEQAQQLHILSAYGRITRFRSKP